MKTRPQIGDQEILQMMDFDKVLSAHKARKKSSGIIRPLLFVSGGIFVILATWYFSGNDVQPTTEAKPEGTSQSIVADSLDRSEPQQPEVSVADTKTLTEKKEPVSAKPIVKEKANEDPKQEKGDLYLEAEPVNGYPDLYAYFKKELKYPIDVTTDSIEGIVSVTFIIDRAGKPDQVKITNSLGPAFDAEAIRVITNMPSWKAASLNGKNVPAKISVPLTFQITRTTKP